MRSFKKLIAGLSSLVMCLSLVPVGASASTSYFKGDVNCDGVVNGVDSLALSNFLNGKKGVTNGTIAERLDYDQNGVIDNNDLSSIKNIILGTLSLESTTSKSTSSITSQSNSRTYYVYDSNGNYQTEYTLNKVNSITASSISATSIFDGSDDRRLDNSLLGVVRFHYINESNGFTGFVVDKHTILTAAHCVTQRYNACLPASSYNIEFFNENGSLDSSITATPVECHIPYDYIYHKTNNNDEQCYYDYALITVQEDLSDYICSLGTARNNIKSTNPDIYVTGYSNTYLSLPELHGRRATAIGKLTSLDYYNLHYDTDTTGGNSGAPVYVVNSNGTKTVIGIHCYGSDVTNENNDYNYCTRITTDILHFVYNNSNLSW